MHDYSSYSSVFSWRYGSKEMRGLFSEERTRRLWRRVWISLARAQVPAGLVTKEDVAGFEKHQNNIDIRKAQEIEKHIKHDLMAELKVFAEQSGRAGGKLHLGATSMDIEDNAEMMRMREALSLIEEKAMLLLSAYKAKIDEYGSLQIIAATHLQPAEPSTLGYRFANYAQDLLLDLENISFLLHFVLKGKGFKGAVGTAASYFELLKGTSVSAEDMEKRAMKELHFEAFEVSTQTYPRKADYLLINALASICASLHKFAFDLRVLQSPFFGELQEPFAEKQVGSSAMPFKRNPVKAERVCSLARYVSALPPVMWNNAANSLLERTLDDSANRRIAIPEAFLATDEALTLSTKIVQDLQVNKAQIKENFEKYAPFAMTEVLLLQLARKGADRQHMHEVIRDVSMKAWKEMREGKENPLKKLAVHDKRFHKYLKQKEVEACFDSHKHVGLAEKKCAQISSKIAQVLKGRKFVKRHAEEF